MVTLEKMTAADEPILEHLFQLYLHDMSHYAKFQISENGKFDFDTEIIKAYFNKPDHFPYFIRCDGALAGFALIRRYPYAPCLIDMGQFFILGSHQRLGIGNAAFQLCIGAHAGQWQIRVLSENLPAKEFWRNVVSQQTEGKYHQTGRG